MASLAYLMGESHWIQPSHYEIDAAFAIKPPNKIIGIVNRGAIAVAVVTLGEREEINRPMPIDVCTTSNMTI